MLRIAKYSFYVLLFALCILSCKRNDDEPIAPTLPITRLYVSFSDVYVDDGILDPYTNISVIDPADSIIDGRIVGSILGFNSQTTNGNGRGVAFDPNLGNAFQVGSADRAVRSLTVNSAGGLSSYRFFQDTLVSAGLRDLALRSYLNTTTNSRTYLLYVADMTRGQIMLYPSPQSLVNYIKATKRFTVGSTPFGLHLSNDSLFVSMTGASHEIRLYQDLGPATGGETDTLVTPEALASITVTGASDLRGLAYSNVLDYLVVADNGGSVFIIEDAKAKLSAGGAVSPSRTITGLTNPADVAIDDRSNKNKLYIADRGAHAIYIYDITTASGSSSQEGGYTFPTGNARTPEFIHLDAR